MYDSRVNDIITSARSSRNGAQTREDCFSAVQRTEFGIVRSDALCDTLQTTLVTRYVFCL